MDRNELLSGNVLITGATGGIGQAIARAFAARGASLVLTGRRTEVLEPLAGETGARVIGVDLSVREEVERLAREAGPVDVLVNNAALPGSGDVSDYSVEEIDRALEVNLRAPLVLSKLIGDEMRARRRGHIVFISSLSGKAAQTGSAIYSATKFGLRGLSISMREDWREDGVGVSAVFPGFIRDAGMFAEADVKLPPGTGTSTPEEVADGVIRAVVDNRAEVEVAPLGLRLGTKFASLAPELANRVSRRLGAHRVAAEMSAGQRSKR